MKIVIILILFYFFLPNTVFSQERGERRREVKEKIEQLEKIKLIESLNMDEETTLRFFARRSEFMNKMDNLEDKKDDLIKKIDKMLDKSSSKDNPDYKTLIDQFLDLEQKIEENRRAFISSLSDILTTEQIARLIVFQKKFREEVRKILFKKKKH